MSDCPFLDFGYALKSQKRAMGTKTFVKCCREMVNMHQSHHQQLIGTYNASYHLMTVPKHPTTLLQHSPLQGSNE